MINCMARGGDETLSLVISSILNHYREKIQPEGFKAQIVTASRRAAILYKQALDRLNGPESAVIISGNHNDETFFKPYTDESNQKELIKRFKKPMNEDSLSILIVKDKLLTGFDAPIEQVMYLDRKLKDHTLLQAIARVNRKKGEKKQYGFIVDYYGLSDYLKEALEMFSSKDVKGALQPLKDEMPKLEARHGKVMRYFEGLDLSDIDACVGALKNDITRAEFEVDFKKFLQSMNAVLPDKMAAPYISDMKKLGRINQAAKNLYRDEQLGIVDAGEKVRKLIDEHIYSEGINPRIPPTPLFNSNFVDKMREHKDLKTQAADLEYAIKNHIQLKNEENPEYYKKLGQQLKEILNSRHEKWEELVQLLLNLRERMEKNLKEEAQDLGFSENEYAFFGILQAHILEKFPDRAKDKQLQAELVKATKELVGMMEKEVSIVDFFSLKILFHSFFKGTNNLVSTFQI